MMRTHADKLYCHLLAFTYMTKTFKKTRIERKIRKLQQRERKRERDVQGHEN